MVETFAIEFTGSDIEDQQKVELAWKMAHPARYVLKLPVRAGYQYGTFEPFTRKYLSDFNGTPISRTAEPIYDQVKKAWISPNTSADLVMTGYTYFMPDRTNDLFSFTSRESSTRSKVPSMNIVFDDVTDQDALAALMPHRQFLFGRDAENADESGSEFARLESIRLIHPSQFAVPAGMRAGVVTRVVATGISRSGIRTTVESLITENRVPNISSPGAILAPSGVEYNSKVQVRWGEIWTYGDQTLNQNWMNFMPKYGPDFKTRGQETWDPWFAYRTSGVFKKGDLYADGSQTSNRSPLERGFDSVPQTEADGLFYTQPYNTGMTGSNKTQFAGYETLLQNQDLDIPPRNYQDWKDFFIDFNMPYYYTDAGGTIWGRETDPTSDAYGEVVGKTYKEWFAVEPTDPNYWEFDYLFAFIDSVPVDDAGNPAPTDPDSKHGAPLINKEYYPRDPNNDPAALMATIREAGAGGHTRGVIFAAADIDYKGQGKPPHWSELKYDDGSYMVKMPNGQVPSESFMKNAEENNLNIAHNGLLHSWGKIWNTGNRTFYGSIHADRGFDFDPDYEVEPGVKSSGTPTVYYNFRMADGSWLSINQSRVRRANWDIVSSSASSGGSDPNPTPTGPAR
jgi:hypothetical protein